MVNLSLQVSLPDGTYIILNGAHIGVSGFASASSPNLTPVLYDPSLPVGQRMRELASTTIARLYHSEAVLFIDGTIIVSGSDPRDPNYPQEYRHEVFTPPYLLAGKQRPAFAVGNNQWNYGGQYAIKAKSPSMANLRFSLIAGMIRLLQSTIGPSLTLDICLGSSSTHGNTMGARTLFLQFNCVGFACLLTAPPNSSIAPPGWYMLFILDGPTPSKGIWVRIGNDPGQIGNWPPGPAFTRPGV